MFDLPSAPLDLSFFFILVIPGFICLKSYYFFRGKKDIKTDFEYLAMSTFVGLVLVIAVEMMWLYRGETQDQITKSLSNPLVAALGLSLAGFCFSWILFYLLPKFGWFKELVVFIKKTLAKTQRFFD
jgi:hypothetical protein